MTKYKKYAIIVSDDTVLGGFMKTPSIARILKGVPMFSTLSDTELGKIIQCSHVVSCQSGNTLKAENAITVILKGSVTVTKQHGDKKLLMRILGAKSVSGVACLFEEKHDLLSTLTAIKPTEALIIDQECVSALIKENSAFAMSYISFLTSRIRFLNGRIRAYTVGDTEAKLALHLLLSDENGTGEIELPVSLSSLADMLDMGRASLYRALDSLTEKGIISRNGKTITVNNSDALKHIAEGLG